MELHQIDLNKLNTFLAVAEQGGVTAAARVLALTPSAVSQSLSGLEAVLGVQLFHRVGRRLVETREGTLLHQRLRDYQAGLRDTLEEIVNPEREARGMLRIGLFLGFPRERLAVFLAGFIEQHPRVRLKVVYGSIQELSDRLLDGRIDMAFSFEGETDPQGHIAATRLFRQELVLVTTRAHARRDFDLASLGQTPVVDYFQSGPVINRWVSHHYRKRSPRIPVKVWAATTNLVLDLVLQGVGVGVLPDYVATPYVRRKRLRVVPGSNRPLVDHIWLKELASGYRSPAVEALRNAAVEEFGES